MKSINPKIKITISMIIWGSLGVFVTRLSLPTEQIVLFRAAIGCLALFLILLCKGKTKSKISTGSFLLLLLIGAMIGLNWLMLFESYKYTYVSTATLIYYSQPIILIILSTLFLKEKLTKNRIIGVLMAIIGMILINGLQVGGADPKKGAIIALGGAFLYAMVLFLNKANPGLGKIDGMTLTVIELLGATLIMIIYTLATSGIKFTNIGKNDIIILLILGIVHTAWTYYLYFSSVKAVDAQSLAVLGYIDPASSLFFSALILHEKLGILQWAGAILILGGALYSQIKAKK